MDIRPFAGINFKVLIMNRFSPVALSLANFMPYEVVKHRGAKTLYRISLQCV